MCTIALALGVVPGRPLVVLSNRDELLARPAGPPRLVYGRVPYLAPVDLELGGTWVGLSSARVFVGITNRFGAPRDPARRSRGEIVARALDAADSVEGALDVARGLAPTAFNPFHLVVADEARAHVIWSDGEVLREAPVGPGVRAITERSFGADEPARARFVEAELRARAPVAAGLADLVPVLASREAERPIDAVCVDWRDSPIGPYGTRSSFSLALGPGAAELWVSDRAPCVEAPRARPELLAGLFA